jgi:hypothetical protein
MHANMGNLENGWLTSYLADLGGSIAAFRQDLGVLWSRVTVVTITEFGRRVSQNQSTGTEHGWGSSTFVAGGGVNGGKIHGRFPGLDDKQLKDGDLVVTADYRSLLTEILTRRAGITADGASKVFPNFRPEVLSVMKHLSETPLPENFPTNVKNAIGSVAYDPDLAPKPIPVVTATATPIPSATPSTAEMVSASPSPTSSPIASTSPTPFRSAASSPSASPTSRKKTITCVKNGKTIRVTGTNPRCPTGYKIKK